MRVQKCHRNQFSRIDGAELFGFTNPLVQRLFRELVANENGTANQNIEDIHQNGDTLQSGVGKLPAATIEGSIRKKRLKLDKQKAVGVACLDSPKVNMDSGIPAIVLENGDNQNQPSGIFDIAGETGLFVPDTLDIEDNKKSFSSVYVSKDANTCSSILIDNEGTASRPFISDQSSLLKKVESSCVEHGGTIDEFINAGPGMENHSAIDNLGKGILSVSEIESYCLQRCIVPDKLQDVSMFDLSIRESKEVLQEPKDDERHLEVDKSNQVSPPTSVIPSQSVPKLFVKDQILSKECGLSSSQQNRQYTATESPDGNSDKADSDSMGQELAKSMITVLLPQALPFLRQAARKKRKNLPEENLHASSVAEYDPNNESFNQPYVVRKKTEKSSSEMCVVSHIDTCELAATDSVLLVGRSVPNCSLGMEIDVLCAETTADLKTPENSCVQETVKNVVPFCSSTDINLENSMGGICKMNITAGHPPLIKLCHDEKMHLMEANNRSKMSKPGDAIPVNVGIEQELYKSAFFETKDDVNETDGEFIMVVSSAKEGNEEIDRSSISPSIDLTAKSKEKCLLKTAQVVAEGLELDVPLGSKCYVNSSADMDNFTFTKKDDKRDYLGTSKQDSVVIDCVVPDSFEDDHCSNDDVKKNSSHRSAVVSCKMPVYEVQPSYETHPQCAANAEEKYMKRKSNLHSGIYDVKSNHTMVHLVDCKGFGETDLENDDQVHFEDAPCEPTISKIEYMVKCDLPGQDLETRGFEIFQHEKCHSVDTEDKTGKSSALWDQYCPDDAQPGIFEASGIGNLHEEDNGAYSTEQHLVRNVSNELLVTRSEIYVSVSCCQLTDDNGFLGRSVEGCISVDKNLDTESHAKYCGQSTNKESSQERSPWAEAKLPVSKILCKQSSDCGFLEQALDVSVGSSQDKHVQNSDIISGIQPMISPIFSDLELASHITIGVSNHHGIFDIPNATIRKANLNQDKDVKVGSYCQSASVEMLNKDSKGIQPVLTFSDVPPSTLKAEVVENNDSRARSVLKKESNVNNLEPVHRTPEDNIINIDGSTDGNKRAMESTVLVGCYGHPIPVLSLLLSVWGKDVHLCVVCGLLQERERILFMYKVVIEEASCNYSCLLGYTRVILPDAEAYFEIKSVFDKYGIQLTADGHNLVLLECIKIQDLREPRVNCLHSKCISLGQCEGHGVKLVSVKNGHVSVLAQLSSMESMYCLLVSAPQSIIAAGENGRIHVWRMDLRWSMCVEEFILPTDSRTTAHIWELLSVPHLPHLIISHNCNGYYAIWDISRRVMLSTFCSMDYNIFQSVVVGVVSQHGCGKMSKTFTDCKLPDEVEYRDDFKDNISSNIVPRKHRESRLRSNHACSHLDFNEEYIAVCILVLVAPHTDKIQINQDENCDELKKKGSWRLALLENKVFLLGDTLDPRASVASVLSQNGVIGTSDGHIYTWEVMNGRKLLTSKDFEGVSISCITADPTSTAFAVAGSDNRVLLYVQSIES